MKKAITILLIFIMIFTSLPQNRVLAGEIPEDSGIVNKDGQTEFTSVGSGMRSVIGTVLATVVFLVANAIQWLLSLTIMPDLPTKIQIFTIEDLLLGRYELFNVNFMELSKTIESVMPGYVANSSNVLIKQNVASWFYSIRSFAIVALLAILIYIGILMAISTIASDKAKVKNMLIHWVASMAILILLPYIISLVLNASNAVVDIINNATGLVMNQVVNDPDIEQTKGINFEKTILYGRVDSSGNGFDGLISTFPLTNGWQAFMITITYAVLVYYQVKFFFIYLKRMLTVGFLITISPLITITYSIDKAGDNKAQAFQNWMKEFLINVFIQPLHAIIFVVFMYSTYGIMERAPLLAIIFLAALSRGEKLVRNIFKFNAKTSEALGKGKGK